MENQNNFNLVKGTFSPEEAESLLNALINYKINYHSNQDFSNHIRFNKDPENSKKRIAELIEMRETVQQFVADAKRQNSKLVINSSLTLEVEK